MFCLTPTPPKNSEIIGLHQAQTLNPLITLDVVF